MNLPEEDPGQVLTSFPAPHEQRMGKEPHLNEGNHNGSGYGWYRNAGGVFHKKN